MPEQLEPGGQPVPISYQIGIIQTPAAKFVRVRFDTIVGSTYVWFEEPAFVQFVENLTNAKTQLGSGIIPATPAQLQQIADSIGNGKRVP